MSDIYTAARAVLEADERGQGQGYAEAMDALRAALTPPAPWAPPPEEERPEGYRCLGKVYGYWREVVWFKSSAPRADYKWWCANADSVVTATAFAPLPEGKA
jgi:hypothetical protein